MPDNLGNPLPLVPGEPDSDALGGDPYTHSDSGNSGGSTQKTGGAGTAGSVPKPTPGNAGGWQ
jgi:hypothetical protein